MEKKTNKEKRETPNIKTCNLNLDQNVIDRLHDYGINVSRITRKLLKSYLKVQDEFHQNPLNLFDKED